MPKQSRPSDLVEVRKEGDNMGTISLLTTDALSDRDILTTIASLPEIRDGRPTEVEAINATVAQAILESGIEEGQRILLSVAAMVRRNLRGQALDFMEGDDGALWRIRKEMVEENDRLRRMQAGLALGDRGTHYAARIGGGYLDRTMGRLQTFKYCRQMALGGYDSALTVAERMNNNLSRVVKATAPVIIDRFADVVTVLRTIMRDRALAERMPN